MQFKTPSPNIQKTFGEITYLGCATGDLYMLNWKEQTMRSALAHEIRNPIDSMAFDDKFVYTGGWDKRIYRYNRDTLEPDMMCLFFESDLEPQAHTDFVKSLCVSKDQKYLFSGSADGCVYRWELPPPNTQINLIPLKTKLTNRFVNSIVQLPDGNLACGGSSRTVFIIDQDLKVVKQQLIKDCNNISKIIPQGRYLFVLSKDIHVVDMQTLKVEYLFVMKRDPVDLWFPPNDSSRFYAACEDGLKIIKWENASSLEYYSQLGSNGQAWTADQIKELMRAEKTKSDQHEIIQSGMAKGPCGLECVKQTIVWKDISRECYMLIYGCHDEVTRRIFYFDADRDFFMKAHEAEKAKERELEKEKSIDLNDDDEDIPLDPEELEQIKHMRLKAMLDGSETWHKDKFDPRK